MSLTKVSYSMVRGAVFNILDYGAIAADESDHTHVVANNAAIQGAIDAALVLGGSVYIPTGYYSYTTGLIVDANVITFPYQTIKVFGDGQRASVLNFVPPGAGTGLTCLGENITLEDIGVYCNATTTIGMHFNNAVTCNVSRCISTAGYNITTNVLEAVRVTAGVNNTFYQLEMNCANSGGTSTTALVMTGGVTTSNFYECYIHHAKTLASLASAYGISFYSCIFEDGITGVSVGTGITEIAFNECYWESIKFGAVYVVGQNLSVDSAQVTISGGFYQAAGWVNHKSGYGLLAEPDAFCIMDYSNKIMIRDLKVDSADTTAQGRLIQAIAPTASRNYSVMMDAKPGTAYATASNITNYVVPDANVSTLNGAPYIYVTNVSAWTPAVPDFTTLFFVGDTLELNGLNGNASLNGMLINRPFYYVSVVTSALLTLLVIQPSSNTTYITASSTGASAGAGGTIRKYMGNTWVNCLIDNPDYTKFNDAATVPLTFKAIATTNTTQQVAYLDGDTTTTGFFCTKHTYIMYAVMYSNLVAEALATSNAYMNIFVDYPTGFSQNVSLLDTSSAPMPAGAYYSANGRVGLRVPPGTFIRCRVSNTGAGAVYPRTDTVQLYIAQLNDQALQP